LVIIVKAKRRLAAAASLRSKMAKPPDSPQARPAGRRETPAEPVRRAGFARNPSFPSSSRPSRLGGFAAGGAPGAQASGGRGLNPGPHLIDFCAPDRHFPLMADTPKSLAEPAREWIASQVASGAWPDADAYLNDLVERDRLDAERQAAFNAAIEKGFASGFVEMSIDEVFAGIRQRHSNAA
jgi:Arc/MetJ-type ribon-helix-helix transcriptional regulator